MSFCNLFVLPCLQFRAQRLCGLSKNPRGLSMHILQCTLWCYTLTVYICTTYSTNVCTVLYSFKVSCTCHFIGNHILYTCMYLLIRTPSPHPVYTRRCNYLFHLEKVAHKISQFTLWVDISHNLYFQSTVISLFVELIRCQEQKCRHKVSDWLTQFSWELVQRKSGTLLPCLLTISDTIIKHQ